MLDASSREVPVVAVSRHRGKGPMAVDAGALARCMVGSALVVGLAAGPVAHAWGGLPGNDGEVREIGASTNRLLSNEKEFDPITGMARQSAIPVNVRPVAL